MRSAHRGWCSRDPLRCEWDTDLATRAMLNLPLFLLQLAVIIGCCQVLAWGFRKAGQPQVVGEMVAGIALGPTLFGTLAPGPYHALFPASSLNELSAMSEAGLVIFLFLIGVRVDFAELRDQSRVAVITSIASILVPCTAGIALGRFLGPYYGTQHPGVFALFIGTAISVTAFPVLARIVAEHNLLATPLGSVAITCAAASDLVARILLATVTALSGVSGARLLREVLLLTASFIAVMLALGAMLRAWAAGHKREPSLTTVVGFMILALASAAASSWIGIHAFVGAFVAGLITPRVFREALIGRLETVTLVSADAAVLRSYRYPNQPSARRGRHRTVAPSLDTRGGDRDEMGPPRFWARGRAA